MHVDLVVVQEHRHDVARLQEIATGVHDAFERVEVTRRLRRLSFEVLEPPAGQVAAVT